MLITRSIDALLFCLFAVCFGRAADASILNGVIPGSLTNDAVLEVGPGIRVLGIGNQLVLTSNSVINLDIGGTNAGVDYDQINVQETVTFGGVLNIRLVNNFQPQIGQIFTLITFGYDVSGEQHFFTRIRGLNLGNGLRLAPTAREYDRLEFVVIAGSSQPPALSTSKMGTALDILPASNWQGFYLQTATNVSGPWTTLTFLPRSDGATVFPRASGSPPQQFLRLFDPDSP